MRSFILTSKEPSQYNKITILYSSKPDFSEEQLNASLKLRDLLEKNAHPYEEEPSRKEVVFDLKEKSRSMGEASFKLNSLADRLEGKVQTT